jgi:hypothetical protein
MRPRRSSGNCRVARGNDATTPPLAKLRQRPATHARRGIAGAVQRVSVLATAGQMRPVWKEPHVRGDPLRAIIKRMRHDGCGGRHGGRRLTGIEGASSRLVRKIVLLAK